MIQQFLARVTAAMRKYMAGRYGTDKLNLAILGTALAICVVTGFIKIPLVNLLMTAASYGLMIWAICRSFSRNTYKRYQENRKVLQFFDRIKDRDHCYYDCPRCRQNVRVPRGKGKIAITCPRCKEKFIRKT